MVLEGEKKQIDGKMKYKIKRIMVVKKGKIHLIRNDGLDKPYYFVIKKNDFWMEFGDEFYSQQAAMEWWRINSNLSGVWCENFMNEPSKANEKLPPHLRSDASYLQCSKCGRKAWSGSLYDQCDMTQPEGYECNGILEGKKDGVAI